MNLPSEHLQKTLEAFSSLPGIGKKTALRLTLHMLNQDKESVQYFCNAISSMKQQVQTCRICHNVSDTDECQICTNATRRKTSICVVEHLRDLIAIEATQQFNGVYHVLGGLISPLQGIGPDQLHIDSLIERLNNHYIEEIIFALSPNVSGDTTVYVIQKKLASFSNVKLSTIARGVSFGGELEYADEFTLSRSFMARQPIQNYIHQD